MCGTIFTTRFKERTPEQRVKIGLQDKEKPVEKITRSSRTYQSNVPCHFCGDRANTRDHLVPRSRGGAKISNNIVPACQACNGMKGASTKEEFLDFCGQLLACPNAFERTLKRKRIRGFLAQATRIMKHLGLPIPREQKAIPGLDIGWKCQSNAGLCALMDLVRCSRCQRAYCKTHSLKHWSVCRKVK